MVMIAGPGPLHSHRREQALCSPILPRDPPAHHPPRQGFVYKSSLAQRPPPRKHLCRPNNPTEITAIIDWQSAYIAPLYDQHPVPSLISSEYNGPPIDDDLTQPKLPADYQSFEPDAKEDAFREYVSKSLMVVWLRALAKEQPAQYLAARFQDSTAGSLLQIARRISESAKLTSWACSWTFATNGNAYSPRAKHHRLQPSRSTGHRRKLAGFKQTRRTPTWALNSSSR